MQARQQAKAKAFQAAAALAEACEEAAMKAMKQTEKEWAAADMKEEFYAGPGSSGLQGSDEAIGSRIWKAEALQPATAKKPAMKAMKKPAMKATMKKPAMKAQT